MNETAIHLREITKTYGTLTAVDRLSLDVPRGQILALLGPNGAGKSTTTEMILGLTIPDVGDLEVFGDSPTQAIRTGKVGAMLQNGVLLWDITVGALLKLMHGLHAHPLPLDTVIEQADLGDLLGSSTNKLSGGQAQRVRFALAIMPDPDLLILDEPTVGMDVSTRIAFWDTMSRLTGGGRTILFATHYLDEADAFADRIMVIHQGRIIADGTGSEIKATVGGRLVTFVGPDRDYAGVPGVVATAFEGGRHHLTCADSDVSLRALLADPAVRDIQVTAPSLEDAFLELVT